MLKEDEIIEVSGGGEDVRSEADLDALADSGNKATNRERPMVADKEKPQATDTDSFEFTHGGKTVKGTRDQILKWAQQGYDYPQRAQKLNQEKAKWDQEKQQWESEWGIYRQVDTFAKQNKDWWDTVSRSFATRETPTGSTPQPANGQDPYQLLAQKISQLEPLVQQFVEEKRTLHQQAEDSKLDQEISTLQNAHSELDWKSLDENGKSLEARVLEHAQENGISTFRAAFRDLLHDELVAKAQGLGKIAVAKGIQNRTKLGVLGSTPTPGRPVPQKQRNMRTTSYEDLENDIREELRLGRS